MEYGKWIVLAFLTGCVMVGFKSRQLKWYEFIVSGLFLLLLDQLVFHGQIGAWVGQLGSKARGAAAHGALALPLMPLGGGRLRRFAGRLWRHRPTGWDYAACLAAAAAAHWGWDLSWPLTAGVSAAVLTAGTVLAAVTDHTGDTPRELTTPNATDVGERPGVNADD